MALESAIDLGQGGYSLSSKLFLIIDSKPTLYSRDFFYNLNTTCSGQLTSRR